MSIRGKVITATILLFLVLSVSATDSNIKITSYGAAGAVTDHSISQSIASSGNVGFVTGGDNWNENNAATRVVTLGYTKYTTTERTNNRIENSYDGKTDMSTDGGYVAENSYHMEDNKVNIPDALCTGGQTTPDIIAANGTVLEGQTPSHQSTDIRYTALGGNGGMYKGAGTIDDVNVSSAVRSEGNSGGLYAYWDMDSEAGFNKSSSNANFKQEVYGHKKWTDLNETGYSAGMDIQTTDRSVPFETLTNITRMTTDAVKDAEIRNQTETNISVNLT